MHVTKETTTTHIIFVIGVVVELHYNKFTAYLPQPLSLS